MTSDTMAETWNKAAVDEFTKLKEIVLNLKKEMAVANKRIRELEPDVTQVIKYMHAQENGDPDSDIMPVLLFKERQKVVELKTRKRAPALNMALLEKVLRAFLMTNSITLQNVDEFLNYLKLTRKDNQRSSQVLHYRQARLSELKEPIADEELGGEISHAPVALEIDAVDPTDETSAIHL